MDNESSSPNPSSPAPPQIPPVSYPPAGSLPRPEPPRRERKGTGWKIATILLAIALLGVIGLEVVGSLISFIGNANPSTPSRLQEVTLVHQGARDKIAVIPVEGVIMGGNEPVGRSLAKGIDDKLKLAAKDERVKAVILRVNSPGGEVLASDDIAASLSKFQQKYNKPVIASMGSLAASGGYYISAPCRSIVANDLTMTGSIGVIMQTYNVRGLMNKVGVRPLTYTSGKFKDMLSMSKEIDNPTPEQSAELKEEEALMRKIINDVYERFKSVVADGRKLANGKNSSGSDPGRALDPKWTEFADGRILSGREAFDLGLVDELGNFETAVKRAMKFAGIAEANLVTYQEPISVVDMLGLTGKSEAKGVKLDMGLDLPKLQSGLYYLAPSFLR